jgi:hypothetical protein
MPYITPIRILRSSVYNKRPNPSNLLEGQPAYNSNEAQPGLFLKNSLNGLTKIGPISVGPVPPNDLTDPEGAGDGFHSVGEGWLDTSGDDVDGPVLKIWDGEGWSLCSPGGSSSTVIVSPVPPATTIAEGSLWWNPAGDLSILYEGTWVTIVSSTGDIDGGLY